jgi:hypothetical protein
VMRVLFLEHLVFLCPPPGGLETSLGMDLVVLYALLSFHSTFFPQ